MTDVLERPLLAMAEEPTMGQGNCPNCGHARGSHSRDGCVVWIDINTGVECPCKTKYMEISEWNPNIQVVPLHVTASVAEPTMGNCSQCGHEMNMHNEYGCTVCALCKVPGSR